MLEALVIPVMGILSAWSGGSLWPSQYLPKKLTMLPELAFAAVFAAPYAVINPWLMLPVALWSYAWMQSATAPGLHWGTSAYNPNRKSSLKPFVDVISPWDPSTVQYCRLYMAVKGFLIGLPVGGLPLAILWPLGYEIGHRLGSNTIRECAAGAGAGLSIYLFMLILT